MAATLGVLFLISAARAGAAVPIELKDGRSFDIIGLERDGATVYLTTDTGVRFPMKAAQIKPPDEAWTARAREQIQNGNYDGAMETARLLRIWDPSSADHAALLSAAQAAIHGTKGREIRDAISGTNWGHVAWMLGEADGDEDLLRLYHETLGEAARRKKLELRPESLIGIERFMEHLDGLDLPHIAQVEELRTAIATMKQDQAQRSQQIESRQRELEQGRALQSAITQALSFSAQRQYDRARGILESLEPELRGHPEVARTLGLVDAQEIRESRGTLVAEVNRLRRAQHIGAALREVKRLNSVLQGDRELLALERELWMDHRRAVQVTKANQQQSRGATVNVATRPGDSYQVFFPWAYDGERPLPVVLAISGAGIGSEMVGLLETLAAANGFIVVSPNGSLGRGETRASILASMLDDFQHRFYVEEGRGIATGYGDGATAAIQFVARHPKQAFGALAMSGGDTDLGGVRAETKFPIVFLVGQDEAVHYSQVRPAVDFFRRLGHPVDLMTFAGSAPPAPAVSIEQALSRLREMAPTQR